MPTERVSITVVGWKADGPVFQWTGEGLVLDLLVSDGAGVWLGDHELQPDTYRITCRHAQT